MSRGFRVWDIENEEYRNGDDVLLRCDGSAISRYALGALDTDMPVNVIIERDTGLKDKNGKEICEGDIMRYDAIDYQVLWSNYYASFETKRINSEFLNEGLTLHFLARVGRVIGNIHENPELLGGEK